MESDEKPDDERSKDPRVAIINNRLKRYIEHYQWKRDKNRFCAYFVQGFMILISGTITVLLGLKDRIVNDGVSENRISATLLILSALVTAVTSWSAFADYRWKWIRYRAAFHRLRLIRDDFKYQSAAKQPLTREQFDKVFARLLTTVKELDDDWTAQSTLQVKDQSKLEGGREGSK